MAIDTTPVEAFLGENNRLPDTKLVVKDGAYLRAAVNVDVTEAGSLRRRKGVTLAESGGDCHSLHTGAAGTFFVDYDTLYVWDGVTTPAVAAQVVPGSVFSYADAPQDTYATNGSTLLRLHDGGASVAGIELPVKQPEVAAVADGALHAGLYTVTVTHLAPDGEESGALAPVQVLIAEDGAIEVSDIPIRDGYQTAVYVSTANSDVMHLVYVGTEVEICVSVQNYDDAPICRTVLLSPMPAGRIVAYLNGRLYVAIDNLLVYSEPYMLHLFNPSHNYVLMPEPITMVLPCQNGFYLSSDQTYWVDGDMEKADLNPVLPYRAIAGTGVQVPNANACWWMSERGMVIGTQDGAVKNVQEDTVAVDPGTIGAAFHREQDGLKQMIASTFNPTSSIMAARSYMDAEIVRKQS